MGEVVWPGSEPTEIDLDMASTFDDHAATSSNMTAEGVNVTCDETKCSAHIYATVNNITNVQTYNINGNDVAYTPIKFTVQFNGPVACPYVPTPASCFTFASGTISNYDETNPSCPSNVVIPSSIGGTTVTTIGASAFQSNSLTCVKLPNTITTIGGSAFRNNNIISLNIPSSVTTVSEHAFRDNDIPTLTVPSTVTAVGYYAFSGNPLSGGVNWNSNIASTCYGSGGPFSYTTVGDVTLGSNVTQIPACLFGTTTFNDTSFEIPDQVTAIGASAFQSSNLTSVNLNNVITIGSQAFRSADLTSLTIPSSVTTIGQHVFRDNNFSSITVPSTVTAVGIYAFAGNPFSSGTINWDTNINNTCYGSDGVFSYTTVGTVNFGASVNRIPACLFRNTTFTNTSFTVPNQIVTIYDSSFRNSNLTSTYINNGTTTIQSNAFNTASLTSATIDNSSGNVTLGTTPFGAVTPTYLR